MKNKKGFTLIETVIFIVLMGIIMTPVGLLISNLVVQNSKSQIWATVISLAEGEMERVTGTRFSAVGDEAVSAFASPFTSFTKEVVVDYVNANNLDTSVVGPTDYKRVQIKVTHPLSGTVSIVTLVSNDW